MEADEQPHVGRRLEQQHVLVDEDEVVDGDEADDADEVRIQQPITAHLDYAQLPSQTVQISKGHTHNIRNS